MGDFNLVKIDGKPAEKLIDTLSSAMGAIFEPMRMRRKANTEAKTSIIAAQAKVASDSIILEADKKRIIEIAKAESEAKVINAETDNRIASSKADAEYELAKRAAQRFLKQETTRQHNLEDIGNRTFQYLENIVSQESVSEDFKHRFVTIAQDVTDDNLKELWAKILAKEVSNSNSISSRTMALVADLSSYEAKLFEKFCSLCSLNHEGCAFINSINEIEEFGFKFKHLSQLRETGLLYPTNTTMTYRSEPFEYPLLFRNKIMVINTLNKAVLIINNIGLTTTGLELYKALKIDVNDNYLEKLSTNFKAKGYITNYYSTSSPNL